MAKKSSASLTVVPLGVKGKAIAPESLTDAEKSLFDSVVATKPAEWFGEDSLPLLVAYVRASLTVESLDLRVAAALAGSEPAELDKELAMRDREVKRVASLATKLRLTQQSRYQPSVAAVADRKAGNARPWES